MSRGSVELTNARKNEIIEACSLLYKEKNYNEITIKDIANAKVISVGFKSLPSMARDLYGKGIEVYEIARKI